MPPKKKIVEEAEIVQDAGMTLATLPVVIPAGTELAMFAEDDVASLILSEDRLNDRVNQLVDHCKKTVIDISTGAGRDELRSFAMQVRKTKVAVEKVGKASLTDLEAEKKRRKGIYEPVVDRLDELATETRKPLTDWEDAEERRKAKIQANMDKIVAWGKPDRSASMEDMEDMLAELDEFVIDDETMPGKVQHALDARKASRETLVRLIEEAQAAAEQAAALTKANEEKQALQRQLDEQKAESERLERERAQKDADEKAERERLEREREAKELAAKREGWKARIVKIQDMGNISPEAGDLPSIASRRLDFLSRAEITEEAYGDMLDEAKAAVSAAVAKLKAIQEPEPEPETVIVASVQTEPEPEAINEADEGDLVAQDAAYQALVGLIAGTDSADEAAFAVLEAINAGDVPHVSFNGEQ